MKKVKKKDIDEIIKDALDESCLYDFKFMPGHGSSQYYYHDCIKIYPGGNFIKIEVELKNYDINDFKELNDAICNNIKELYDNDSNMCYDYSCYHRYEKPYKRIIIELLHPSKDNKKSITSLSKILDIVCDYVEEFLEKQEEQHEREQDKKEEQQQEPETINLQYYINALNKAIEDADLCFKKVYEPYSKSKYRYIKYIEHDGALMAIMAGINNKPDLNKNYKYYPYIAISLSKKSISEETFNKILLNIDEDDTIYDIKGLNQFTIKNNFNVWYWVYKESDFESSYNYRIYIQPKDKNCDISDFANAYSKIIEFLYNQIVDVIEKKDSTLKNELQITKYIREMFHKSVAATNSTFNILKEGVRYKLSDIDDAFNNIRIALELSKDFLFIVKIYIINIEYEDVYVYRDMIYDTFNENNTGISSVTDVYIDRSFDDSIGILICDKSLADYLKENHKKVDNTIIDIIHKFINKLEYVINKSKTKSETEEYCDADTQSVKELLKEAVPNDAELQWNSEEKPIAYANNEPYAFDIIPKQDNETLHTLYLKGIKECFDRSISVFEFKNAGYSVGDNPISNITGGAEFKGETPLQCLLGYATKHIESFKDLCKMPEEDIDIEVFQEKVTDMINYAAMAESYLVYLKEPLEEAKLREMLHKQKQGVIEDDKVERDG